jgi:hypothetical protein
MMLLKRSSTAHAPGGTRQVASYSSTMHGPPWGSAKAPRCSTGVSNQPSSGIADRLGVRTEADADLDEITQDVAPDAVLDELEATESETEQH